MSGAEGPRKGEGGASAPPKASEPKRNVLLLLFESDLDRIQRFYPKTPYSRVIRIILRKHLDALERKIEAKSPTKDLPIDL